MQDFATIHSISKPMNRMGISHFHPLRRFVSTPKVVKLATVYTLEVYYSTPSWRIILLMPSPDKHRWWMKIPSSSEGWWYVDIHDIFWLVIICIATIDSVWWASHSVSINIPWRSWKITIIRKSVGLARTNRNLTRVPHIMIHYVLY